MAREERFPATVSVSLLLTHGRSGRLFMTRHGTNNNEPQTWGLIAGGVKKDESPWDAVIREAREEANIRQENIIFVQGRNSLEAHAALIKGEDKIRLGLVFDTTYSGPKVSMDGWNIDGDKSVDRVELFPWQRVLRLLDNKSQIHRPEFNYPQLIRWILKDSQNPTRVNITNEWLFDNLKDIPGLSRHENGWNYIPPYNQWMNMPGIRGLPEKTNFARERFLIRNKTGI